MEKYYQMMREHVKAVFTVFINQVIQKQKCDFFFLYPMSVLLRVLYFRLILIHLHLYLIENLRLYDVVHFDFRHTEQYYPAQRPQKLQTMHYTPFFKETILNNIASVL